MYKLIKFPTTQYFKYAYRSFTQPVLSEDGTLGVSAFACAANNFGSGFDPYKAFDGAYSSSNAWIDPVAASSHWYTFYNQSPLNITSLTIRNRTASAGYIHPLGSGTIYGSDDNSTWTEIVAFTNTTTRSNASWTIDLSTNTNYYKYHKIVCSGYGSDQTVAIGEIIITATEKIVTQGTLEDHDFSKNINMGKLPSTTVRKYYKNAYVQPTNPSGITTNGWSNPTRAFDNNASTYATCNNLTHYIEWDIGQEISIYRVETTGNWISGSAVATGIIVKSVDGNGVETEIMHTSGYSNISTYHSYGTCTPTLVSKLRFYIDTTYSGAPSRTVQITIFAQETEGTSEDYDFYKDRLEYKAIQQ